MLGREHEQSTSGVHLESVRRGYYIIGFIERGLVPLAEGVNPVYSPMKRDPLDGICA